MRILKEEDVERVLDAETAIQASKDAFGALHDGGAEIPDRIITKVGDFGNSLFKPGTVTDPEGNITLGLKIVHVRAKNAVLDPPLPTVPATISLFDPKTGMQICSMGATFLTAMRTAAGSAIATDLLSSSKASVLFIFGAGMQAHCHVLTILAVRKIKKIIITNRSLERAQELTEMLQRQFQDIEFIALKHSDKEEVKRLLNEADVVCTTTGSSTPVFDGEILKDGCHVNCVGSYMPTTTEIDFKTVERALVVLDIDEAKTCGDVKLYLDEKKVDEKDLILGNLGWVLKKSKGDDFNYLTKKWMQDKQKSITLFKSGGTAAQDLTTAAKVLERCTKANLGTSVEI